MNHMNQIELDTLSHKDKDGKYKAAFQAGLKHLHGGDPNLIGVDIGADPFDTPGATALRFWVENKENFRIPDNIPNIPTAVIQTPRMDLSSPRVESSWIKHLTEGKPELFGNDNMVQPGDHIRHPGGGPGTLGALIRFHDGKLGILSAGHVIRSPANNDDPRFQFVKWQDVEEFAKFKASLMPEIDAAVAEIVRPDLFTLTSKQKVLDFHVVKPAVPKENELLHKFGFSTRYTWARFSGEGCYKFRYRGEELELHGYTLLPGRNDDKKGKVKREISKGGDSGSLWYNSEGEGIGITVKGETVSDPEKEFAILAPLTKIMEKFEADGMGFSLARF
ncbi:MAG: hypothetical protein QNK37_21470 [Acidobacteriota bacterium]|nr:hypothetical protein [Acidobacteriota bacterium]